MKSGWIKSALMGFIWAWYMCKLALRNRKAQRKRHGKLWMFDPKHYKGIG